ncbi:MAG: hypothetical protein WBQ08_23475 [Candidatus Sulfotelmatobacter sp.]
MPGFAGLRVSTDSKIPLSGASAEGDSLAPEPQKARTALLEPAEQGSADPSPVVPEPGLLPGLQLWLHRISVFLFVLISAVAGVLLIILPWTPEWTDNYLLLSYPSLRTLVSSGFFRGICTGLGLLDIWIGFWEALHYHEHR